MTIHHQAEAVFDLPASEIVTHIRSVLATDPSYQYTVEDASGMVFSTEVTSYWAAAPTPLTILVVPKAAQTVLQVRVASQVFIWSEVFATESPAIQTFLNAIRQHVQQLATVTQRLPSL